MVKKRNSAIMHKANKDWAKKDQLFHLNDLVLDGVKYHVCEYVSLKFCQILFGFTNCPRHIYINILWFKSVFL